VVALRRRDSNTITSHSRRRNGSSAIREVGVIDPRLLPRSPISSSNAPATTASPPGTCLHGHVRSRPANCDNASLPISCHDALSPLSLSPVINDRRVQLGQYSQLRECDYYDNDVQKTVMASAVPNNHRRNKNLKNVKNG